MNIDEIKDPKLRAQIEAADRAQNGPRKPKPPEPARPSMAHTPEDSAVLAELCDTLDAPRLERDLQKICETELTNQKLRPFLHLSPKAREKIGWPDLCFALPPYGRFCAVELKTKTGVVSPEQAETLADLAALGAAVAVVRSLIALRQFLTDTREQEQDEHAHQDRNL